MTAVLHNQSLFRSLVSCLKSNSSDGFESSAISSTSASQANSFYIPGRKRGLSFDNKGKVSSDGTSNKSLKSVHGQSAMAGKRMQNVTAMKPQMNIKIVAATILYVAMEPLDHWPVPLVEAYAEDCFGPRTWVDHPACRLLVQNLSLIHREDNESDQKFIQENASTLEADGLKVAEFYRTQNRLRSPRSTPTPTSMGDVLGRKRSFSTGSESSRAARLSPISRSKSTLQAKATARSFMSKKNDGDTSDSGDEEEVAITTSLNKASHKDDDGSSSSSGEDEEMCVMNQRSLDAQNEMASNALQSGATDESSEPPPPSIKLTYPLQQQALNFSRVRQRYFGQNLKLSYLAVSEKLNERLDIKSKQNSGLLHCLPYFISIPSVRTIATANLEKWLQSPALSGLARTLFSKTVNNMKNVDPPLPEDLEALDNILRMRLKANQLNAHIGNITAVATKIPTLAVTKHIYGHILREILVTMDAHDSSLSDHLSMIHAVHEVLPGELCANGIATSILDMLTKPPEALEDISKARLVRRIQKLIQCIAKKFGALFDSHAVLKAMLSYKVDPQILWTMEDEEYKARIMLQCVTLLVPDTSTTQRMEQFAKAIKASENDISIVKAKLVEARKLLIRWCCVDYAPLCPSNLDKIKRSGSPTGSQRKKKEEIVGAGPPDYSSILDGVDYGEYPRWVEVMRCMLFLESSKSPTLRQFFSMGDISVEELPEWESEAKRIDFCCDCGADVDDETMWVILKTATKENIKKSNNIALTVLEHIFECCKMNSKPSLLVQDSNLLSKLYDLVEYIPPVQKKEITDSSNEKSEAQPTKIPRLGYPGMWWRVTGLALILCGASPKIVGAVALEKFPTLRALIKMITSDRYRFPTVDCDEKGREEQKKIEQAMRDEEARITEQLFAPPKKAKKQLKNKSVNDNQFSGHRSSKRQREKREQELKRQREKEEAEARMEANRRKKLLRTAQKSITIWDPKEGPRKPPKESADLIFSIGELFDLPRVFQRSIEPDFVLETIGSTTRGAIERAHDWLIPIISFLPETISRLPASASCFLLLRAYGAHAREDQSQLHELSAPLLQHVRDSLIGKFGEADAVRAFDLLLTDIASHNPDRRRCARRVLTNAIGKEDLSKDMDSTFTGSNHAWAINLMHVEHTNSILEEAVKHLAVAASFERGGNLRYLVLALRKITLFAEENEVLGDWKFPSLLVNLLSRRPTVFAGALTSYEDLRSLAIEVVSGEFDVYATKKDVPTENRDIMVNISLRHVAKDGEAGEPNKVQMPLALLQSSCVLLSIWLEDEKNNADSNHIRGLAEMLMQSRESEGVTANEMNESDAEGLASATLLETNTSAMPVESWVMLAKSRSDFIAKRAALAAPTIFLPRLLLCSGLPRASLLTMIDRLGKVGEKSIDANRTFNQLLVPSASSEWDLGRLGHRREISRKLFGRICAYLRMYNIVQLEESTISFLFVEWLSTMCQTSQKSMKLKVKKTKSEPDAIFASIENAKSLFDNISSQTADIDKISSVVQMEADASDMTTFVLFENKEIVSPSKLTDDATSIQKFVKQTFEENKPDTLDNWLCQIFFDQVLPVKIKRRRVEKSAPTLNNEELSFLLLQCYIELERKVEGIASLLVKWIPKLTSSSGSPRLWRILFADGQKPAFMWDNLVSRCFQIWNHAHMVKCREWILSEDAKEKLDLVKVVRFLIQASTFSAVHVECFEDLPVAVEDVKWGRTEETVRRATDLALDCLLSHDYEMRLRSRNNPPECLVLLLLIARLGRNQVQLVSGAIGKRIDNGSNQGKYQLQLSLLRLYTYFPLSMNLGAAALRLNLMEAVELSGNDWSYWRSPLDDSLEELLNAAMSNPPSQRSIQALGDAAKKHPLLLLRKMGRPNSWSVGFH